MNKKDLTTILAVALFAGVASLVLSSIIITPKSTKGLKAPTIDKIDSTFQRPDKRYFNDQSLNPTQLIEIGDSPNAKPF